MPRHNSRRAQQSFKLEPYTPTPFSHKNKGQNKQAQIARIEREIIKALNKTLTVESASLALRPPFPLDPIPNEGGNASARHIQYSLLLWTDHLMENILPLLRFLQDPSGVAPNTAWYAEFKSFRYSAQVCNVLKEQVKQFILDLPHIIHSNISEIHEWSIKDKAECVCGLFYIAASVFYNGLTSMAEKRPWNTFVFNKQFHYYKEAKSQYPFLSTYESLDRFGHFMKLTTEYQRLEPSDPWMLFYNDILQSYAKPLASLKDFVYFHHLQKQVEDGDAAPILKHPYDEPLLGITA